MTTMLVGAKATPSVQSNGVAELTTGKFIRNHNAIADGSGIATIILPGLQVASLQAFKAYESIKVYSNSVALSTVILYENEAQPQFFVGGSDQGNLNEWVENPPLYTDKPLLIQWTDCDVGATCFARVQFMEVQFVPVRI